MKATWDTLFGLQAVRLLLNDPQAWTKYSQGETETGRQINATHRDAYRWCLSGAMKAVIYGVLTQHDVSWCYLNMMDYLDVQNVFEFNDHRSHKQVLALLDRRIAAAVAELEST